MKEILKKLIVNSDQEGGHSRNTATYSAKCSNELKTTLKSFSKEYDLDGAQTIGLCVSVLGHIGFDIGNNRDETGITPLRLSLTQSLSEFVNNTLKLLDAFEVEWNSVKKVCKKNNLQVEEVKEECMIEIEKKDELISSYEKLLEDERKSNSHMQSQIFNMEKLQIKIEEQLSQQAEIIKQTKSDLERQMVIISEIDDLKENNSNMKQRIKEILKSHKNEIENLKISFENNKLELRLMHDKDIYSALEKERKKNKGILDSMQISHKNEIDTIITKHNDHLEKEKRQIKVLYEEQIYELKANLKDAQSNITALIEQKPGQDSRIHN